jgi:hypothetical protein
MSSSSSSAANKECPWSGKPVSSDSLTSYRGHTVGFCNTGCRDKFVTATTHFDKAIGARDAALAASTTGKGGAWVQPRLFVPALVIVLVAGYLLGSRQRK